MYEGSSFLSIRIDKWIRVSFAQFLSKAEALAAAASAFDVGVVEDEFC